VFIGGDLLEKGWGKGESQKQAHNVAQQGEAGMVKAERKEEGSP
jgi:hypothetical protein